MLFVYDDDGVLAAADDDELGPSMDAPGVLQARDVERYKHVAICDSVTLYIIRHLTL